MQIPDSFKRTSLAVVAGGILLLDLRARATSVYPATTEDLAHIADLVIVGDVEAVSMKQEPVASGTPGRTLRTHNSIKVLEVWKGETRPGERIDVVDLGGSVSGHSVELPGTCGYQVGERVLLFLQPKRHVRGEWLTLGLFLGKLTVLPDGKGGELLATLHWKMEERGRAFAVSKVPSEKFLTGQPLVPYATQVKAVIDADRAAGIDGKWLPQYDHMGVGR